MRIVSYVLDADPHHERRLGALLDGWSLVDLQAAHFSMTGAPHPLLGSLDAVRQAGERGEALARAVLDWATTQRPPGTMAALDAVRLVEP